LLPTWLLRAQMERTVLAYWRRVVSAARATRGVTGSRHCVSSLSQTSAFACPFDLCDFRIPFYLPAFGGPPSQRHFLVCFCCIAGRVLLSLALWRVRRGFLCRMAVQEAGEGTWTMFALYGRMLGRRYGTGTRNVPPAAAAPHTMPLPAAARCCCAACAHAIRTSSSTRRFGGPYAPPVLKRTFVLPPPL